MGEYHDLSNDLPKYSSPWLLVKWTLVLWPNQYEETHCYEPDEQGLCFDQIEGEKQMRWLSFDRLEDGDKAFVAIPVVSCLLFCWGDGGGVYKGNDQFKGHEWITKRKKLTQEMSEGHFSMGSMNE